VNFIGLDGHVRELYLHPGVQWVNNDLTMLSGNGVAPTRGSALDGYVGPDDGQHVNFIGLDGHLHELYIHPHAQWIDTDLNSFQLAKVTHSLLGAPAKNLAPISAFELNLVGRASGESTVFSSGGGTFTYSASTPLTVLNAEPTCTESNYFTGEKANSVYGPMDSGPSDSLVQYFSIGTEMPKARKGRPSPGLNLSGRK
jgi:hypothetical protein